MSEDPPAAGSNPPRLRLIFFGSGAFGLPTLQLLSQVHDVSAIVTQPDRPAGRKRTPTPTPIGAWAAEHLPDTPLIKPESVNAAEVMEHLRGIDTGSPDARRGAWVVIAFGQKLSRPLLTDRFAINLHASLLPRWRGAAPINHAILAGDARTGNSVITLADRMDAGLVLGQSERSIEPQTTAGELHDQLAADGPQLIRSVLDRFSRGALDPVEQDETSVTIAGKLTKATGQLNLAACNAETARRHIHGLNPWPGVTVLFRDEPLKIHRASVVEGRGTASPGTVEDESSGIVSCEGQSLLRLLEVQPAGKKPMSFESFAHGAAVRRGERLGAFDPAEAD